MQFIYEDYLKIIITILDKIDILDLKFSQKSYEKNETEIYPSITV